MFVTISSAPTNRRFQVPTGLVQISIGPELQEANVIFNSIAPGRHESLRIAVETQIKGIICLQVGAQQTKIGREIQS